MIELLAGSALGAGAGFMALAAIGLLRLPDLYTRMHAVTKASTLGLGLLLLGSGLLAWAAGRWPFAEALVLLFVFLTNPVGAHLLARAAYLSGLPMSAGSFDEFAQAATAKAAADDRK